jgi:tight adherence protein C
MSLELLIALAAVFLSVGVFSAGIASYALSWMSPERRRLEAVLQPRPGSLTRQDASGAAVASGHQFAALIGRSAESLSVLERRLAEGGFRHPSAASVYSALELILPLLFGVPPIWYLGFRSGWFFALVAAVAGHVLPGALLWQRIDKRRREIQDGLPDALDLLVLCVEAGSSLDAALVKAGEELTITYPSLADELKTIIVEMRAGKPRIDAFRNLATRTNVDDVRSLVAVLVQTDRFGTSIAQALRTHADTGRTKRRQRAEEAAGKIGVKIVFPLVLCLFPALYVVLLGPAIIEYMEYFRP